MSIKIQPVRFYENGFMTRPFALGISPERSEHCEAMSLEGCEGAEGLDPAVKYRSCLQNWVIDTGSEVILVDTGLPAEFPEAAADPDAGIFLGTKIKNYLDALADLGYKPEQVSKILITHKHADHTGELRAFPNAQIICSAAEAESDEIKPYKPTVATFTDGPYYEFPASQRIAPGVTYISAPGHTTGNCSSAKSSSRPRAESTSARSAAMCTIPPNMTASRSRTFRPTGAARAASSRRKSSTARKPTGGPRHA